MKRLLCILLFSSIGFSSFSQINVRPGVKIGANLSTVTKTELNYKTGLVIGAFATVRLARFYALQPEVLYIEQGGKSPNSSLPDINTVYISFLLSNKFYIVPESSFYLMVGPSIDANIKHEFYYTDPNIDYAPVDMAVYVGLGYEFDFGLGLEASYKQGLLRLYLKDNLFGFHDNTIPSHLNSGFLFTLNYKFEY